jgi:two-component system phosphate regulon sensor histidine kinase PhoR
LQAELPPRDATALADEEGARTILDNLIDNALKYTPAGGRVTVRCRFDEQQVTLEVEDTGIGIAEKDQSRVFERFYRVDKARSREVGGTGLGLSIVKHLAQSFDGSVSLDSQPGRGSIFRVQLPRGQ